MTDGNPRDLSDRFEINDLLCRFQEAFGAGDFFHSYGYYRCDCVRTASGWRISGITQTLLRNAGTPQVHGATRTPNRPGPPESP